jgi:formate dehydrogenase major subunit
VFLLPAADAMEKAGSIVTSGRRIQWRTKVAGVPGVAKEDIWMLTQFVKALKELYKGSTDAKDRPILDLVWDYGDPPDVEKVAQEINGYALENVVDATGKVLVEKGKVIPGFATVASAANPDAIACGVWIYSGYFAPADDGEGKTSPASKRRGQKDPGNLGLYPYWGFSWPANRHILYNRASARPMGHPGVRQRSFVDKEQSKRVMTCRFVSPKRLTRSQLGWRGLAPRRAPIPYYGPTAKAGSLRPRASTKGRCPSTMSLSSRQ